MVKVRLFFVCIVLIFSGKVISQVVLDAQVDKDLVAVNEQFSYVLTTNKNCEITPPRFRGLQVVAGPYQGQSHSSRNINGKTTSSTTYTFTWYLKAKEMGIYTIERSKMACKDSDHASQEIKIKVASPEEINTAKEGIADHYLTLESNKESVFEGEPFILSLKFYSKKRPQDVENYSNGLSSGIERHDLRKPTDNYPIVQKDIKGVRYYIIELRKELCIPLRAGKVSIEPSYGSMWYEQNIFEGYRLEGYSNGLEIDVKAVPEEAPEHYIGLVGSFEMDFEMDKVELSANQALEFKMTLKGNGNFNSFDPPPLNVPDHFIVYDPEIKDSLVVGENGIEGTREYVYSIVPKEKGEYKLTPFQFSYFDLSSNSFKTLTTGEVDLIVNSASKAGVEYVEKQIPTVDTTDIRYIHQGSENLFKKDDFFYGSLLYYVTVGSPLCLALLFISMKRRKENMSAEARLALKQKGAKKSTLKVLDESRNLLQEGQDQEALKSLQNAMFNFFMTHLNMPLSELSKNSISTHLKEKNISAETIASFESCWTKIEMAQYAPVGAENMANTIDETEKMIQSINSQL